ncbi:hypothetical protein KBC03_05260 [Patescibacteria group bacterium]|nr:hypothetical protein [Patescibacteria group bacterium]
MLTVVVLFIATVSNSYLWDETFKDTRNFRMFLNAIGMIMVSIVATFVQNDDKAHRRKNARRIVYLEYEKNVDKVKRGETLDLKYDLEGWEKWKWEIAVEYYKTYQEILEFYKKTETFYKQQGLKF